MALILMDIGLVDRDVAPLRSHWEGQAMARARRPGWIGERIVRGELR